MRLAETYETAPWRWEGVGTVARADRKALIQKIETARKTKVICYLTSDRPNATGQVQKDVMPLFYEHLRKAGATGRVDVLIFTIGGDTLAAFGIARLIREFSPWVGALVPEKCQSAGTLFVLGANEIMMTKGATLSPIDPSILGPLNPVVEVMPGQRQMVPLSVESVAGFKALVVEDWDMKGEAALTSSFRILAERVHPLALGDVFRARQQIEILAGKLLRSHRADDDAIKEIVRMLTKGLGSHDYLISRREAREMFGAQIAVDDEKVEAMVWDLYRDFADEMQFGVHYDHGLALKAARAAGGSPGPVSVIQRLVMVESVGSGSDVVEAEYRLSEKQPQLPLGAQLPPGLVLPTTLDAELVRAGWTHYAT